MLSRSAATAAVDADDRTRGAYEQTVPQGRVGTGDDFAEAVLLLASPASSHRTGPVLDVDGGVTIAVHPTSFA